MSGELRPDSGSARSSYGESVPGSVTGSAGTAAALEAADLVIGDVVKVGLWREITSCGSQRIPSRWAPICKCWGCGDTDPALGVFWGVDSCRLGWGKVFRRCWDEFRSFRASESRKGSEVRQREGLPEGS
jgi:hypothetical protein